MAVEPLPISLDEVIQSIEAELSEDQVEEIRLAYQFALEQLGDSRRTSGELHIHHALGVAKIVASLGLDGHCMAAALLHEVVMEDTGRFQAALKKKFFPKTIEHIAGLHEIGSFAESNQYDAREPSMHALENMRHAMLILVRKDVHVILIRMADMVLELRYAAQLEPAAQLALAIESMNIYAPLANRLGVWKLKWELEDLAFRYLEPALYKELAKRLNLRRVERDRTVQRAVKHLQRALKEANINGIVTGRAKHIYSIYRKMERKQLGFDEIYDKHAIRVIVFTGEEGKRAIVKTQRKKTIQEARGLCYQVMGIVHGMWQVVMDEFDDYIASPKPNGYQSLHTAVIDENGQMLEVQIRTDVMHTEAERGVAAHWAYKERENRPGNAVSKYIETLREMLHSASSDATEEELSDADIVRSELLDERIFVYTPGGDMIDLPINATPVDFAYAIHSAVGHHCRGAKVNSKMVSLDHKLESGDRVEIIKAKYPNPSRDWMNPHLGYSASPRTRSKIRRWFRQQERDQNIEQGRDIIRRELKRLGLLDSIDLEELAAALSFDDVEALQAAVGFGDIHSIQISGALSKLKQKLKPDDELLELFKPRTKTRKGLTVKGVSGLHTKMAGCCSPIPPEPIIGFVTRGHGVTIHRKSCRTLSATNEPERFIDVDWGVEQETYPIPIVIESFKKGTLQEDISKIMRGRNITISKTKSISNERSTSVYLVVEITSLNELDWVLKKLANIPQVLEVRRQRWAE